MRQSAAEHWASEVLIFPQKLIILAGIGIDVGVNVVSIGYDGRVVDASIEGLTVGITYMYKDGKMELGIGAGWIGWSFSVDFLALFNLLFGGS